MHPGMFGIHLITEACRQWGEAGDARGSRRRVAFVSGTGATLSASSTWHRATVMSEDHRPLPVLNAITPAVLAGRAAA